MEISQSRKFNSVQTTWFYTLSLYQISYIPVKENIIKCEKISVKFMQKRITFGFTKSYKHSSKPNSSKIPVSTLFFCPYNYISLFSLKNTPYDHQSNPSQVLYTRITQRLRPIMRNVKRL